MDYDNYILNEYISFITPITSSDSFQEYVQIFALAGFGTTFTTIIVSFFGAEYLTNNATAVQCFYNTNIKDAANTVVQGWVTTLESNPGGYNTTALADILESELDSPFTNRPVGPQLFPRSTELSDIVRLQLGHLLIADFRLTSG
eukprot:CAMPEP_0170479682 /NCGR_PEP_ID=MMETSP0208-20121228/823_1 /TAXON_ID=197538 /ORGANISM="Strombidium inclinatum, Strain S3" /LENGTH=144 /DNA_ID=CAMNT_0010752121 /DNA_START=11 /DNA_END=440 /DNA_ORIENTATION=+